MKLYSGPLSLFTAKVRIALAEKGLDYERIEVGWSLADRYLPHHPDVVALNPNRQVPILVDGDTVVYDSTIIFEYLEDRWPDPPLYPAGAADRAACRRLEAEADETVFAWVWDLIEESLYPPGASNRDPDRLRDAKAKLAQHYQQLDKQLADRDYLVGDFSVADIGMFVFTNCAVLLGAPVADGLSNLNAWLDRMSARPAVATDLRDMQQHLAQTLSA